MDAFKLAFETTIVGIAAFLWIGIAIDLISPTCLARVKSALDGTNESLIGVVLLATAYGLGSAILPISAQLVNDEHWPLPEDAIRCRVAVEEQTRLNLVNYTSPPNQTAAQVYSKACACSSWNHLQGWDYTKVNTNTTDDGVRRKILTQFEILENRALGQGTNREELFRQLRERMIVLRGAAFSGFILFLICLFGCIAPERGQPRNWWRASLGIVLASSFTLFVIYNGLEDLASPNIFDIPVLEAVLGAISLFGGYLAVRGVQHRPYLRVQFLLVIIFGAALAYGGWMWSEILYDQQVITSSAVLLPRSEAPNVQTSLFLDGLPSQSSSLEVVH